MCASVSHVSFWLSPPTAGLTFSFHSISDIQCLKWNDLVNKICVLILVSVLLLFIYLAKSKHVINSVWVDEKRQDSFLITFHKAFTPLLNRWQYVITQAVEKKKKTSVWLLGTHFSETHLSFSFLFCFSPSVAHILGAICLSPTPRNRKHLSQCEMWPYRIHAEVERVVEEFGGVKKWLQKKQKKKHLRHKRGH